ncbi:MAG: ABC transporter permease [Myxococcota bacterium]
MELSALAFAATALRVAIPLLLAALGELVAERAGVLNIGIEGMMLSGAFAAFAVAAPTGSIPAGVAAAALAGSAGAALFAVFVIVRGADPIVTGTALNLLALGATGTAYRLAFPPGASLPSSPSVAEGWTNPFPWGTLTLAAGVGLFLRWTRVGLSVRAAGERAEAAHAQGVPVIPLRVCCTLFGGLCAGLAGAALVLWVSNTFVEGMTSGRGFIALSIVLFGAYRPLGLAAGALLFGAASAVQFQLQALGLRIPYSLLLMSPYVLTLAVLALFAGRARGPADLARPFHPRS